MKLTEAEVAALKQAEQQTKRPSEMRWTQAFAASLPQLEKMGRKALEDYRAGRTQDLDADTLE